MEDYFDGAARRPQSHTAQAVEQLGYRVTKRSCPPGSNVNGSPRITASDIIDGGHLQAVVWRNCLPASPKKLQDNSPGNKFHGCGCRNGGKKSVVLFHLTEFPWNCLYRFVSTILQYFLSLSIATNRDGDDEGRSRQVGGIYMPYFWLVPIGFLSRSSWHY